MRHLVNWNENSRPPAETVAEPAGASEVESWASDPDWLSVIESGLADVCWSCAEHPPSTRAVMSIALNKGARCSHFFVVMPLLPFRLRDENLQRPVALFAEGADTHREIGIRVEGNAHCVAERRVAVLREPASDKLAAQGLRLDGPAGVSVLNHPADSIVIRNAHGTRRLAIREGNAGGEVGGNLTGPEPLHLSVGHLLHDFVGSAGRLRSDHLVDGALQRVGATRQSQRSNE